MFKINSSLQDSLLRELWKIRNPHTAAIDPVAFNQMKKQVLAQAKKDNSPLSKKASFELTTSRNRNLINVFEQNKLRQTVVAFFGMSVGSHAALTWMMESRADCIKISDPDTIDASNLNRLRFGWQEIGRLKTAVVAEKLQEINPFAKIISTTETSPSLIDKFVKAPSLADIIVDEIDDFQSKIFLRQLAKKYSKPLISVADVGDNLVIDIERYDLLPQPQPFLGRIPHPESINFSSLSTLEKKKLIIRLVGFEHNSEAMLDSLVAVGGSIPTWPQLGATATISGGVIATTLKNIALDKPILSGRYYLSLDQLLVSDFTSPQRIASREAKIATLNQILKKTYVE